MAKATFYWKPSCTTCRNARRYLDTLGVDVEERDINKTPPSREFLEQHVDGQRFLDFVSTRSPVFRERPLPTSTQPSTGSRSVTSRLDGPAGLPRPLNSR